jgi:hypothetical protein
MNPVMAAVLQSPGLDKWRLWRVRKLSARSMQSEMVQRRVPVEGAMAFIEAAFNQRRKREMEVRLWRVSRGEAEEGGFGRRQDPTATASGRRLEQGLTCMVENRGGRALVWRERGGAWAGLERNN